MFFSNDYVLDFIHDEVRLVSNEALERTLQALAKSKRNKIRLKLSKIAGYRYWAYLLNTFNSNYSNCHLDWWDKGQFPLNITEIFQLFGKQLEGLRVNGERCFDKVEVLEQDDLDAQLTVICREEFINSLRDNKSGFSIFDDLSGNYIKISISI